MNIEDFIKDIEKENFLWASIENGKPICFLCPTKEELYNTNYSVSFADGYYDIRFLVSELEKENTNVFSSILNDNKYINPIYEDLLKEKIFKKTLYINKDKNIIKKNIIDVIMFVCGLPQTNPTPQQEKLTKKENEVLEKLKNKAKESNSKELNVSVSQLVDEYNVSRSVFISLFYKMKEYNIAKIDSRGVKGTHITFY